MSTSSESALIIKRLTLKVCCIITYLALCDSLESAYVCQKITFATGFSTSIESNTNVKHYRMGASDSIHGMQIN